MRTIIASMGLFRDPAVRTVYVLSQL